MDGDGFVGPYLRSLRSRLQDIVEGNRLRRRHGIVHVAKLIDRNGKEITQRNSPPQFKIMGVIIKLSTSYKEDIRSGTKTKSVIDATKKVAGILNLLSRQNNIYRKTYQSCMMDSTDYKNVKVIGERIDMDSTIALAQECLPNLSHEDMATNEDVLQQFWGTQTDTLERARRYLRGETLPESEYASGLDTSSESGNDSNSDSEEEETPSEHNTPTPDRNKKQRKTSARGKIKITGNKNTAKKTKKHEDDQEDSFVDNDEDHHGVGDNDDWHPDLFDDDVDSSVQNHNKISDEHSEDEWQSDSSEEE